MAFSPDGTVARYLGPEQEGAFLIFKESNDGGVKAKNCATGKIDYHDRDAAVVLQSALEALRDGGKIILKEGVYGLSTGVLCDDANSVELCGQGAATVLTLDDVVNKPVIHLASVSDWYVHDLRVDGNKANQEGGRDPQLNGIDVSSSNNIVIANNYVSNCRTFGIQVINGANCRVFGNYVTGCGANGITVGNPEKGARTLVLGNFVDTASDVGITAWRGIDVIVASNFVSNISLEESPYGVNSHVGIMQEQSSQDILVVNNHIESCATGVSTDPSSGQTNTNVSIENNQIRTCGKGVYINRTNGVMVKGNLIDTTMSNGIVIDRSTDVAIVNNQILRVGGPSAIDGSISGLMIDGNSLRSIANGNAIVAWGHDDWVVTGNCIEFVGGEGNGIVLGSGSNNWMVGSNRISSCAGDGIRVEGGSSYNTISGNRVSGCAVGVNLANSSAKRNMVSLNNVLGNEKALIDNGTMTTNASNVFE